jgi:hypothetical protein
MFGGRRRDWDEYSFIDLFAPGRDRTQKYYNTFSPFG